MGPPMAEKTSKRCKFRTPVQKFDQNCLRNEKNSNCFPKKNKNHQMKEEKKDKSLS